MIHAVVLSFIVGVLAGIFLDLQLPGIFLDVTLMVMLFFIGYDLAVSINYKRLKKLILVSTKLVVATVAGSAFAGLLVALIFQRGMLTFLAASLGMGWYSLTGPLLLKFQGSNPGLLGFLANVLREIFTFIFYPLFYRHVEIAAVSMAGATSMDTTLPLIRKTSGSEVALVAIVHGWIISTLVPIILMYLLSTF